MSKKSSTDESQEPIEPEASAEVEETEAETVEFPASKSKESPESTPEQTPEEESELNKASREAKENYDRYMRALADLENYRRRVAREKEEIRRYALGSFLEEFTSILDNLHLGLDAASQHPETKGMVDGFSMVIQQMNTLLNQHGLEEVLPRGEDFDPNLHDCLSQQASESVPEGTVLQVIRRGYSLNGRLLRPAAVIVSSGKPTEESSADEYPKTAEDETSESN